MPAELNRLLRTIKELDLKSEGKQGNARSFSQYRASQ